LKRFFNVKQGEKREEENHCSSNHARWCSMAAGNTGTRGTAHPNHRRH
jgi:hypothetical protein